MNKTISMSIRVSEEELNKLKRAAIIENYASYSEFIRRTALKEADKIVKSNDIWIRGLIRDGVSKSLQPFWLKTDGPLRANFHRIKQGGYPQNPYYMKISAEYRFSS